MLQGPHKQINTHEKMNQMHLNVYKIIAFTLKKINRNVFTI